MSFALMNNTASGFSLYLWMVQNLEDYLVGNGFATQAEFDALDVKPHPSPATVGIVFGNNEAWEPIWERMALEHQRGYRDGSANVHEELADALAEFYGEDHPAVAKARAFGKDIKAHDKAQGPVKVAGKQHVQDNLKQQPNLAQPINLLDDEEIEKRKAEGEARRRVKELTRG